MIQKTWFFRSAVSLTEKVATLLLPVYLAVAPAIIAEPIRDQVDSVSVTESGGRIQFHFTLKERTDKNELIQRLIQSLTANLETESRLWSPVPVIEGSKVRIRDLHAALLCHVAGSDQKFSISVEDSDEMRDEKIQAILQSIRSTNP